MCDEIIANKPETFTEAYEVTYTLEATQNTNKEVKVAGPTSTIEATHKLSYARPQAKKAKKQVRLRSSLRGKRLQHDLHRTT